MKAVWCDQVIAESDQTIVVERRHYFPPDSVNMSFLKHSDHTSRCIWKGLAHYYDVVVGDEVNKDAAWYYPEPKRLARKITGYVGFWRGVEIVE